MTLSYAKIKKHGQVSMFWTLILNLIYWIQLCDKKNLAFVDCCDKKFYQTCPEKFIKLAKGSLNLLQDNKISDWSKLQAFADNKLNVTQNIKVVFHRIENIVEKEENAGYQHFLLFPQCFRKAFSSSASKVVIVW